MSASRRGLTLLPGRFAICRFAPDAELPAWLFHEGAQFWSITRSPDELSVVCNEDDLPPSVTPAPGRWRAFEVHGPIPFEETGVIAGIAAALASAAIPVFAIATHDTDFVLVPEGRDEEAKRALGLAGHAIHE